MKYQIKEITPLDQRCGVGPCPGIYEFTSKDMNCVGLFPSNKMGDSNEIANSYLIIGQQVSPQEFGLEKKIGPGEVLIKISKELIDRREKSV